MGDAEPEQIRDYIGMVETLSEHGGDLAEIGGATKLLGTFSKATTGLGLVGLGFDLALSLFATGP